MNNICLWKRWSKMHGMMYGRCNKHSEYIDGTYHKLFRRVENINFQYLLKVSGEFYAKV